MNTLFQKCFKDILDNVGSCHSVTGLKAIRATLRHLSQHCIVCICVWVLPTQTSRDFSLPAAQGHTEVLFSRRAVTSVRLQLSSFRLKAAVAGDVRAGLLSVVIFTMSLPQPQSRLYCHNPPVQIHSGILKHVPQTNFMRGLDVFLVLHDSELAIFVLSLRYNTTA